MPRLEMKASSHLLLWMEDHRETFAKHTDAALASMATAELGFPVTPSQIKTRREKLGMAKRGAKKQAEATVTEGLEAVEARLTAIEKRLDGLDNIAALGGVLAQCPTT